ncbi:MAG: hypothetical protein FWB79_04020 [Treponema sp.]|nr:hypothetical protein [Treponema sp.]
MARNGFVFGTLAMALAFALAVVGCEVEDDVLLVPPTEVRARVLEDGRIQITWNASQGARRYDIAFRTEFESGDTRRQVGSAFITSHTHRPIGVVGNDPVLIYYVRAANRTSPSERGNRNGAWSAGFEVGSVPWTSGYTAPANPRAERDGNSIRVTWDRIPAAVQYELQYSVDNVNWSTLFTGRPSPEGGGTTMTRVHSPSADVVSGAIHYRVRASNTSVEVEWRILTRWATYTVSAVSP